MFKEKIEYFFWGGLIEYSYVDILPQITQITQRNTAWLYYFAEYFVWIIGVIGIILCKSVRYIEVYLVID